MGISCDLSKTVKCVTLRPWNYINTGGDAPLTDTTATHPQAALLSPPMVSRKIVYSEEMVVFKRLVENVMLA